MSLVSSIVPSRYRDIVEKRRDLQVLLRGDIVSYNYNVPMLFGALAF
jgi:hypothetical protein